MDKLAKHSIHRYILLCLMVASTLLVAASLTSSIAYANYSESTAVTASAVIPSSCTMSGQGASSHSANTLSGTYTPDIGTTTVNVICNDPSGFSIYAAGFTGGEMGQENSNKLVGANTGSTIVTGTATSAGVEDKSNWAMKLATDSGAAFEMTLSDGYDDYHEVPNSYTKVATRTAATDIGPSAAGSTLTTTYATYISKTQPADTYTGQVKYLLVHPSTEPAPGAPVPLGNATFMQDNIDCPSTPTNTIKTLTDSRDSQEYIVGKAADGNCWMLQNLKLGKNDTSMTLTATTSDVSNDFILDNKLTNGKFHSYTVDGIQGQNNSSEYYCTNSYGCYYNWYTATAGTGTTSVSSGEAASSICPAGWTLPTQPQFLLLYSKYHHVTRMLVNNPTTTVENTTGEIPGFLLNGRYNSSGASGLRNYGNYWARSTYSAQTAYSLSFTASNVVPDYYEVKYVGFAVRCVLK